MTLLPIHSNETAPEGSKEALGAIVTKYGFLPNLAGVIANSPAALNGFLGLASSCDADAMTLTPTERQVVLLAASATNACDYCIAAHSMLAKMAGLGMADIEAIQDGRPMSDTRLEALRALATSIVESRGHPGERTIDAFLAAGFRPDQLLEVVLGIALKTFTNYVNHMATTPINEQFAAFAPARVA